MSKLPGYLCPETLRWLAGRLDLGEAQRELVVLGDTASPLRRLWVRELRWRKQRRTYLRGLATRMEKRQALPIEAK